MTRTAMYENSRWRTTAILKIALSPYLSRELSDFDQIWHTDTNFRSEHANLKKKSKFFKFKMADDRYSEYSFISISPSRIIRFRSNLVHRCKFPFRGWLFDKNRNFSNSKWRTEAILKIVFFFGCSSIGTLFAD